MADITVTPANVLPLSTTIQNLGVAGATLTAGQPVYMDPNQSNQLKPCQSTSALASQCVGIALHAALIGQPVRYAADNSILTITGAFQKGSLYCISANAGGIMPTMDADTSWLGQTLLAPIALTASGNTTGLSTAGLNVGGRLLKFTANVGVVTGTTPSMTLVAKDSPDNITFTAISGGTFTAITSSGVYAEKNVFTNKPFVRMDYTITGTTPNLLTALGVVAEKTTGNYSTVLGIALDANTLLITLGLSLATF